MACLPAAWPVDTPYVVSNAGSKHHRAPRLAQLCPPKQGTYLEATARRFVRPVAARRTREPPGGAGTNRVANMLTPWLPRCPLRVPMGSETRVHSSPTADGAPGGLAVLDTGGDGTFRPDRLSPVAMAHHLCVLFVRGNHFVSVSFQASSQILCVAERDDGA